MATNRLDILKQMLAQDPQNSFARYGLAMEFAKIGDLKGAAGEFKSLLASDSTYVAAYYHCGQVLEKLGDVDGARDIYEKGVVACAHKGDRHTLGEIEAALSLLPI
jgi:tetratricopeptide (TPR) repeat protein